MSETTRSSLRPSKAASTRLSTASSPKSPQTIVTPGIGAISRRSTAMTRPERLRPAPGRSSEIDHIVPGTHELVAVRDLDQLVGRARAVALRFRAVNVGIIDVAPEPRLAGFAAGHSVDFLDA